MATRVPARLTVSQGRRFGLTVGAAFLVLAGVTWWRDHLMASQLFGVLGAALSIAGLVMPTHLGPVERAWMALAHAISKVTTPIVMAVMYFVVITPFGLMRRAFAQNPVVHRETDGSFWIKRPVHARRSASMERQF